MTEPTDQAPTLHQVLVLTPARDAEGRPLLESKSPLMGAAELAAARSACPFEESPSRFKHAKPMNEAALVQVRAHFGDFLGLLGALRARHSERVSKDTLTLADWHRICLHGEALPRLLLLRAYRKQGAEARRTRYFAHPVPTAAGIVFKTVRGLLRLTRTMQDEAPRVLACLTAQRRKELGLDSVPKRKPKKRGKSDGRPIYDKGLARDAVASASWIASDLVTITEKLELMVGDDEVCAAPPGMLEATFKALVDGRGTERAVQLEPEVATALDDFDSLDAFTNGIESCYVELNRFRSEARNAADAAAAEVERMPAQRATAVLNARTDAYLIDERRFLDRLRQLQPDVLRPAGCTHVDPALDLGLIDDLVPTHLRRLAETRRGQQVEYAADEIRIRSRSGDVRTIPYKPA